MNYLRRNVFGPVADGVNDHSATDRAIRTSRAGLAGSNNLQHAQRRVCWLQIKSKNDCGYTTNGCKFQEVTAGWLHGASLRSCERKTPVLQVTSKAMLTQCQVNFVFAAKFVAFTGAFLKLTSHATISER